MSTDKEINKDLQNTDLQNIFFNGKVIKRIARHRHYQMSALLLIFCGNFPVDYLDLSTLIICALQLPIP